MEFLERCGFCLSVPKPQPNGVPGHNFCICGLFMDNFYVACDLGAEVGRVSLGTLHRGKLSLCEIRRFDLVPIREKNSLHWNIPELYQEILEGLRSIGAHEEPVHSISCSSWPGDYMLFEQDGTLLTPTFHFSDPRTFAGMTEALSKVPWETVYEETGLAKTPSSTLSQLSAEKWRRIQRNRRLLPIADGFNFLLTGVARAEMSLASSTQLFNPATRTWSDRLLQALKLPSEMFPGLVPVGTKLGRLKPEIVQATGIEDAQVVAGCSHQVACALAGLPVCRAETWAFLEAGSTAVLGTELIAPIINDVTREWEFSNEVGFGGSVRFSKRVPGLWILDECRRVWNERDRSIDADLLMHLATSSEPFESLLDLSDPRFHTPGDMPAKIQAFCRETNQPVPRKPGPTARCVLESLALLYRRTLHEMECVTGREFNQVYALGGVGNSLLHHFTANALQLPVTIVPSNITAIGNVITQAIALGHIHSLADARELVRESFRTETLIPHAAAWDAAFNRLAELGQEVIQ